MSLNFFTDGEFASVFWEKDLFPKKEDSVDSIWPVENRSKKEVRASYKQLLVPDLGIGSQLFRIHVNSLRMLPCEFYEERNKRKSYVNDD